MKIVFIFLFDLFLVRLVEAPSIIQPAFSTFLFVFTLY